MHRSGKDEKRTAECSDQAHRWSLRGGSCGQREAFVSDRDDRRFAAVGARRDCQGAVWIIALEKRHRYVAATERRGQRANAIDEVLKAADRSGHFAQYSVDLEGRQRFDCRQRRRLNPQIDVVVEQYDAVAEVYFDRAKALAIDLRRADPRLALNDCDGAEGVGAVQKLAQRYDGEVKFADC